MKPMRRRTFLRQSGLAVAGMVTAPYLLSARRGPERYKVTLLHTNDVHSRMEPFPAQAGDLAGLGGASRRTSLVRRIREVESEVLLLDAGDILQGTPYFNLFDGEVEFRAMEAMGYDAATLGNHDFDGGLPLLERRLPGLSFPMLNANYDFTETPLAGMVAPYRIFEKGPVRVGIFGLGVELAGLVPDKLYGGITYMDPLAISDRVAHHLKKEERCQLVVCLSHLGLEYPDDRVSDRTLAAHSTDIDIILGGHTHTLLREGVVVRNAAGGEVHIGQVGWGGAWLGRMDVWFERNFKGRCITCRAAKVSP